MHKEFGRSRIRADHPLKQSVMLLSFATAAVLLVLQWQIQRSAESAASSAVFRQDSASEALILMAPAPDPKPSLGSWVTLPAWAKPWQSDRPPEATPAPPPVPQRNTRLLVDLSDRRVTVYRDGKVRDRYPIAIGQAGWETPSGTFHVTETFENPVWQHPITGENVTGPDNPLGSRWIGFWSDGHNQIGFHGTNEEALIGQAVSHGCVRMRNQDIEQMFREVEPGTPVVVQP